MSKQWCNTEDYLGYDPHYAHESKFEWIMVNDDAKLWCSDCRYEWEERSEQVHSQ